MLRAVLLVVLLALPLASSAAPLQVAPDEVASSDGTLLVRWDAGEPGRLHLTAGQVGGVLSDSIMTDRPDTPVRSLQNVTGTRDHRSDPLPDGARRIDLAGTSGGSGPTILVHPLSPAFQARITDATDVALDSVEDELLEYNHAYGPEEQGSAAADHYEFRVRDVVAARASGPVGVAVDGDFLLYVWNATVTQTGPGGAHAHRTGTWREPGSAPGLEDIHYRHALLLVRDGHLRIDAPSGAALFASELVLDGADGGLLGDDSGTLRATRDGPLVDLAPEPAANTPTRPTLGADTVGAFGWSTLAVVLLAGLWVVPNLHGSVDLPPGTPAPARFRAARADGFRRLAVRAEGRFRYRLAALWMGRAVAWDGEPEWLMQHAIYLRLAGDHGRALARHRDAEEAFRSEGIVHALNAYEAARAAAGVGRVHESLQWLLAAIREEPWLGRKAPFEPDLAPLRALPAFVDVAQAADDDGLLRP